MVVVVFGVVAVDLVVPLVDLVTKAVVVGELRSKYQSIRHQLDTFDFENVKGYVQAANE